MVRPVVCPPAPMVEEAEEMKPVSVGVPVSAGDTENTAEPEPVSSVRSDASSELVSIEVEPNLPLKRDQSTEERYPF